MNNQEELTHHGILGMKWGVRRYQNKDGSLTPAGKKKAAKMKDEYTALTGKRLIRKPTPKNADSKETNKRKGIRDLSDTELTDRINRLTKEKQLAGLEKDTATKSQKFVSTVGTQVLAPAAINAGKTVLERWFTKVGSKMMGIDEKTAKSSLDVLREEAERAKLEKSKYENEQQLKNMKKNAKENQNNSQNQNNSKKQNKSQNQDNPKKEEVKTEWVDTDKNKDTSGKSSRYEDDFLGDAEFVDLTPSSTALVPYKRKGEDYVRRFLK